MGSIFSATIAEEISLRQDIPTELIPIYVIFEFSVFLLLVSLPNQGNERSLPYCLALSWRRIDACHLREDYSKMNETELVGNSNGHTELTFPADNHRKYKKHKTQKHKK